LFASFASIVVIDSHINLPLLSKQYNRIKSGLLNLSIFSHFLLFLFLNYQCANDQVF
jgi:hypothetical protein